MSNTKKSFILNDIDEVASLSESTDLLCLTGMRPSGKLHLGHYVGALESWKKFQDDTKVKCQFLLADYHVMGDRHDMSALRQNMHEVILDWLSVGLDPDKSDFVAQSYLPETAELTQFLMNFTPNSELERNPTLKREREQVKSQGTSITA